MTDGTVKDDENITEGKTIGELIEDGSLNVGSYVNYKPDGLGTGKSYTSLGSINGYEDQIIKQENLNWRILSINKENSTVTLISDKPTYSSIRYKLENRKTPSCSEDIDKLCNYLYSAPGILNARNLAIKDFNLSQNIEIPEYSDDDWNTALSSCNSKILEIICGEEKSYFYYDCHSSVQCKDGCSSHSYGSWISNRSNFR